MDIPGLEVVPFYLPPDESCDTESPITSSSIHDNPEPEADSSPSSSHRIIRPESGQRQSRDPAAKKGFVAMPTQVQWDQGFRPGWLVNNPRSAPEDYSDALKMYHEYKKSGNLVYPKYLKGKKKEDKVASIAATYKIKKKKGGK
jgi:hypothetical protein